MSLIYSLIPEVGSFLSFLNNNNLVDVMLLKEDNDIGFQNRLRLQKLIYIAQKRFNLPSRYFYTIYKHGPYSPTLTNDIYEADLTSIDDIGIVNYELDEFGDAHVKYEMPSNFDQDRYISLLSDKDIPWLEIATTVIHTFDKFYYRKNDILMEVNRRKPDYQYEYIEEVYSGLVREKLISTTKEDIEKVRDRAPDLFQALAKDNKQLIKH